MRVTTETVEDPDGEGTADVVTIRTDPMDYASALCAWHADRTGASITVDWQTAATLGGRLLELAQTPDA